MDLDANVGKLLLCLDITSGCSPFLEAVLPAETDAAALAAAITAELQAVLTKHLGDYEPVLKDRLAVQVHPRTGIILDAAGREKDFEKIFVRTPEELEASERRRREREAAIDNHPANGKPGYWHVEGIRHDCIVRASSCREALEKALADGAVGGWEVPEATFIGEEMPEVF